MFYDRNLRFKIQLTEDECFLNGIATPQSLGARKKL